MKAIFFDFDGTLTKSGNNSWSQIWKTLSYKEESNRLYKLFLENKITYEEWSQLTCKFFKLKGMSENHLKQVARDIEMIKGIDETLKILKKHGISINIVSGSIKQLIEMVLGDSKCYFDNIYANIFIFDEKGLLTNIETTKYDYEGKYHCVKNFIETQKIKPQDVWFVGNSSNDEWVYKSGCHTLCINPEGADIVDKQKWNKTLLSVTNLQEVLKVFKFVENENICENSK